MKKDNQVACIGDKIYFGTLIKCNDESILNILYFEGTVKEVICYDRFAPFEIDVNERTLTLQGGFDDFYRIIDEDNNEIGWFICDLVFEDLIFDLYDYYLSMQKGQDARKWILHDLIEPEYNLDGIPLVYKWENGEIKETDINADEIYFDGKDIEIL